MNDLAFYWAIDADFLNGRRFYLFLNWNKEKSALHWTTSLFTNINTEKYWNSYSSDSGPKKFTQRTYFDTFMPIYGAKFYIPFTGKFVFVETIYT